MKLKKPIHINYWLLPVSYLYGFVICIRNNFFKWGILKQKEYPIPIICVGNISVGGTGKTPHTEYLVSLLRDKYKVAVLSRGYKRKSSGFILSTAESTAKEIGDEPYQIKQKFKDIILAVDSDRRRGIEKLLALDSPPEVIILDDGFQHRYVKPSYIVILSDYNRPIYEDRLLPAGRLRESTHYLRYASDILVTKCPDAILPLEYRLMQHDYDPYPFQGLYCTKFGYKSLVPVFESDNSKSIDLNRLKSKSVLLLTAIASTKSLESKLNEYVKHMEAIKFPDHHSFSKQDLKKAISKFNKIENEDKIIVVTEKDASKLKSSKIVPEEMKSYFYCLPIEVSFLDGDHQKEFEQKILKHVEEYKRNS